MNTHLRIIFTVGIALAFLGISGCTTVSNPVEDAQSNPDGAPSGQTPNPPSQPKAAAAAPQRSPAKPVVPPQKHNRTNPVFSPDQIKTVFIIALENHDWTQRIPDANPQQLFGNPAAPYVNSLVTRGHTNAEQVSFATKYYSVAHGAHPSEYNYIWAEAGTTFGIHTDSDPKPSARNIFTCQHLTGQMNAAGITWKTYQEDLEYTTNAMVSKGGAHGATNVYNGTTYYSYAVKHNPMQFFTDTQNTNCFTLTQLWTDLAANTVARYNWVTPDEFNEMHSRLPTGYVYHGHLFTGNQAAIAQVDHCLSLIIPRIMASTAYRDHGVIFIWTDETVSTDDTHTTLPFILISPLAKGNAYASHVVYTHSSTLKMMDEIFGLAYQTNAIPLTDTNAFGTGYNRVATANDLSDLFKNAKVKH
ncbi:MAG TPA: alkaline phosphatase family protein [Verrucomicrobiae bacterium]